MTSSLYILNKAGDKERRYQKPRCL